MLMYKGYLPKDVNYILRLIRQELEPYDHRKLPTRYWNHFIRSNQTQIIFHKEGLIQKRIGFVTYSFQNDHLYLAMVALEKNYQHQGFGHEIIRFLETVAFRRKLHSIQLHVGKANHHAINAYNKYGFTIVGDTKSPYYLMKKIIDRKEQLTRL